MPALLIVRLCDAPESRYDAEEGLQVGCKLFLHFSRIIYHFGVQTSLSRITEGDSTMDQELITLLARAREVKLTDAELEEHRIALAVANGYLSDSRVTVDAMKAARTVEEAAKQPKTD
jgi:hypothetical protein